MEPILIDRHIAAIVSRCSHWRDPEEDAFFEPPEMQQLIVEPNPDGGVFIVATDGHILCRGTDSQGFTPVKGPVFVDRPPIPEGYGFDNVRSYQMKIEDFSVGSSDRGKKVLKRWRQSAIPKEPFSPTEYPMINPRFLGCILPIRLSRIRTHGPINPIHFFSECGRFKWAVMPMRSQYRLGFCGDEIEVRNWQSP